MRFKAITLALVAGLALAGCGETTGSRAVSGTAIGAAGGAALGAIGGNAALGAAVGAGAGLLGGFLFDQHQRGNIDF
ncbi:MAG TPA: glycine zipper family protein [Stellaceae bacterium]|nr:glycine zipper family protein [Stellaceae bacterium]